MSDGITLRFDVGKAIDDAMPLVERGLDEGLITEEEAGELLTEAVLRCIVLEEE